MFDNACSALIEQQEKNEWKSRKKRNRDKQNENEEANKNKANYSCHKSG